ncbi:hypothetical protein EWM64_g5801 [Hericium alpestre]|uniref:F-box domain-containing protein n=1 Tax=Hericium alpestre TaxID=135208 RepID=A0A4Y9ZTH3_9AGAM|nr:hypothetical protein EWM64_g5801 [Hericium alpestre]
MPTTREHYIDSDPQVFWATFILPRLTVIEGVSPRDNIDAVVHARQLLDDELSAMHLAMCSLRTRRNALSLISALPAEILARIFKFYAALEPSMRYRGHRLGWIKATHVCRRWRDIALQFPGLWSDICIRLGMEWTELMLSRSKATPVSIRRDVTEAPQRISDLTCEHFRHTYELELVGMPASVRKFVKALPSQSDTLEILTLGSVEDDTTDIEGDNSKLPENIAGCHLPSLRRLTLKGLWVPWSAPILRGLTHLEVQLYGTHIFNGARTAATGYLRTSHETLFFALKNAPALEILILRNCFPSGPWKDRQGDVLQLPRLKALRLAGFSAACCGLAKRLQIPASCQVQLRCSDNADIAGIFPFLTSHANNGADLPPWVACKIVAPCSKGFRLEMWRLSDALEATADKPDIPPSVDADLAVWFRNPERSLRPLKALCQALPLQSIGRVNVSINVDCSSRDWIDMLGRCTEIQEASISDDSAVLFCRALSMTTAGKPVAEMKNCVRQHLFLGKLGFLRLIDVDFRTWQHETSQAEHLIVQWFAERQQVKAAPELCIELQTCAITNEWVDNLQGVAAVEWDGYEGEQDYADEGSDA